jgi:glutamate synthase (NADPH/NADH) large chain
MCNTEMVELEKPDEFDQQTLKELLGKHFNYTQSTVAGLILADFEEQMKYFVKVFPKDYKKALSVKKAQAGVAK